MVPTGGWAPDRRGIPCAQSASTRSEDLSVPTTRLRRVPSLVVVATLAVLATACQVAVGTDVTVAADGSGRLAITVALDEDLTRSLELDGLDVFASLDELPDDWTSERREVGGGLTITLAAPFTNAGGLSARVAELRDGLDADDPLLIDRLDLQVAADGSATLTGRAGFSPPSSTGLEGAGVQFDGDALAALLAEHGDEVLRIDLRVAFPGSVTDTNADRVDGSVATWRLPVTEMQDVHASSQAPSGPQPWLLIAAVALLGLAIGAVAVLLLRR
jgi:hypothetical protein